MAALLVEMQTEEVLAKGLMKKTRQAQQVRPAASFCA